MKRLLCLLLCALFLTGCAGPSSLPGTAYSGFADLPAEDTPNQAYERGCLVQDPTGALQGLQRLDAFVQEARGGGPAVLRYVHFFETERALERAYIDIVYRDGYYTAYRSDAPDASPRGYRLLRRVTGRLSGAAKDGSVYILTDSGDLTYEQVMMAGLSSDLRYRESLPAFERLFSE